MKIWNSIFGSFKKKKKVEAPRGGGIDAALERAMREMRKERGEKEIEWEVRFTKTLQLGRLYSIVILFGFPGERDGFDPGLKGFVQANRNRAVTIEPLHPGVEPDPLADAEEVFRATVHYEAVQVAAGILAGYLHSSVALNVGIVYGGMNLYNNGFAGGIVAIFLVPVIQSISDRRAKAKGGISL